VSLVVLWSPPRCRSTAFFRMMLQRGDLLVVHEPFSVLAEHGTVTVHGVECGTAVAVIERLRELAENDVVFVKDTTDARYPEVLGNRGFLDHDVVHTFLVRDPGEAIASYHALNPGITLDQIGFEHLHEIFTAVRATTGRVPVVVDAADLVNTPYDVVAAYCDRVGLQFRPEAMRWPAGDRAEWHATSRWHTDVARTTGFVRLTGTHSTVIDQIPHLLRYRDHHLPFYRELVDHRIRPGTAATTTEG
jgi:hypothetical protein